MAVVHVVAAVADGIVGVDAVAGARAVEVDVVVVVSGATAGPECRRTEWSWP